MIDDKAMDRLTELLLAECERYREMIAVSREHNAALLSSVVGRVEASLRSQIEALENCRAASARRAEHCNVMATAMGLGSPVTMSRLLAALPGDGRSQREALAELRQLAEELAGQNGHNRSLAEHRMDLVQGDFMLLQKMVARAAGNSQEEGGPVEGCLLSIQA